MAESKQGLLRKRLGRRPVGEITVKETNSGRGARRAIRKGSGDRLANDLTANRTTQQPRTKDAGKVRKIEYTRLFLGRESPRIARIPDLVHGTEDNLFGALLST